MLLTVSFSIIIIVTQHLILKIIPPKSINSSKIIFIFFSIRQMILAFLTQFHIQLPHFSNNRVS